MNLDDAQKSQVAQWIEQGLKLSEIQNKLVSDLGVTMTYMDVRFLIDDLKLKLKDIEPPKPPAPAPAPAPAATSPDPAPGPTPAPAPSPVQETVPLGNVSVVVDQMARPGALVSGKVKFSDGKTAEWYLDEMGRLGMAPMEKGYRPAQQDVMDFQAELQSQLAKLGY